MYTPPDEIEVFDRHSFINFLNILHQDLKTKKETWENSTLDTFLEAMVSYTEDIQGYYNNTNQNVNADTPSWKVFADILRGAKIYE
jgi:hypothetical protein